MTEGVLFFGKFSKRSYQKLQASHITVKAGQRDVLRPETDAVILTARRASKHTYKIKTSNL